MGVKPPVDTARPDLTDGSGKCGRHACVHRRGDLGVGEVFVNQASRAEGNSAHATKNSHTEGDSRPKSLASLSICGACRGAAVVFMTGVTSVPASATASSAPSTRY